MALTVAEVGRWLGELAPPALAESWDRVGLQLGDPRQEVAAIWVALTVTTDVVAQVAGGPAPALLVAHHPLIFRPLNALRVDEADGALLRHLLLLQASVWVVHTNLDKAPGGLNQWLAQALGLRELQPLVPAAAPGVAAGAGLGCLGSLYPPQPLEALATQVAQCLRTPVRLAGNSSEPIRQVAVVGGAGMETWPAALAAGAQVLVTGDVKFHDVLAATAAGLAVIDAGHFPTERLAVSHLAAWLRVRCAERLGSLAPPIFEAKETDPWRWVAVGPKAPEMR